jgi:hypothetical protein
MHPNSATFQGRPSPGRVIRVYDSFGAPMQMELVKQVSLRSDGVVRERCRSEETYSRISWPPC